MREERLERIELGALDASANRWVLLHQAPCMRLGLGFEDDQPERPVIAAAGEAHTTLRIQRLQPLSETDRVPRRLGL
jgi:hypothetical protein